MQFEELHARLIAVANERVRSGQLTERGLARLCGISQPHIHNVLKRIRSLSTHSADRLMQALDMSAADLLWRISAESGAGVRAVPLIRNKIGPGNDAVLTVIRGHIPLPESLLKGVVNPLMARLAPDLVLPRALAAHDLVLLDQNPLARLSPSGGSSVWVVADGSGLRIRYVRVTAHSLQIANEASLDNPAAWNVLQLQGRNILDLVRARIVWIGREMEKEPSGPVDPAYQGH